MSAIPSDNYIRPMLDGAPTAAFDGLFMQAVEGAGPLTPFQCLDGRVPIALDGIEHFCSRKLRCAQCSTRRRTRPQAGAATAAGVHRAAGRGGEAHTAAYLGVLEWRTAVIARGPTYRFFGHLRTITVYVVVEDWSHLLHSIAAAAVRPP